MSAIKRATKLPIKPSEIKKILEAKKAETQLLKSKAQLTNLFQTKYASIVDDEERQLRARILEFIVTLKNIDEIQGTIIKVLRSPDLRDLVAQLGIRYSSSIKIRTKSIKTPEILNTKIKSQLDGRIEDNDLINNKIHTIDSSISEETSTEDLKSRDIMDKLNSCMSESHEHMQSKNLSQNYLPEVSDSLCRGAANGSFYSSIIGESDISRQDITDTNIKEKDLTVYKKKEYRKPQSSDCSQTYKDNERDNLMNINIEKTEIGLNQNINLSENNAHVSGAEKDNKEVSSVLINPSYKKESEVLNQKNRYQKDETIIQAGSEFIYMDSNTGKSKIESKSDQTQYMNSHLEGNKEGNAFSSKSKRLIFFEEKNTGERIQMKDLINIYESVANNDRNENEKQFFYKLKPDTDAPKNTIELRTTVSHYDANVREPNFTENGNAFKNILQFFESLSASNK